MERIAVGYLRMTANEYELMTPREIMWRYEAESERENRELERTAQLACWVLSSFSKQPVKLNQLIRRRQPRIEE